MVDDASLGDYSKDRNGKELAIRRFGHSDNPLRKQFRSWEKKCFARLSNRPNRRLASFFGQCKPVDMRDLGP